MESENEGQTEGSEFKGNALEASASRASHQSGSTARYPGDSKPSHGILKSNGLVRPDGTSSSSDASGPSYINSSTSPSNCSGHQVATCRECLNDQEVLAYGTATRPATRE